MDGPYAEMSVVAAPDYRLQWKGEWKGWVGVAG